MVRAWSYINRANSTNSLFPYRAFQKRPVYKIFKLTTKLRRAHLPRYLKILNWTWFPRRKYRRRRRQTNWAPLRFIPIGWARLYLAERSMVRFYQTLSTLPFTSLGADPLVLVKCSLKISSTVSLSSFAVTKRITRRFVGNPRLNLLYFLRPKASPVTSGILAFDSQSFIRGTIAAPWGLLYDNSLFSYNTHFPQIYDLVGPCLSLTTPLTVPYVLSFYRLMVTITLLGLWKGETF